MHDDKIIPAPVLRRLPTYLSYVKTLQKNGEEFVSSTKIADYMGIDATQVTKDLSHTSLSGKTRVGYRVENFVEILDDILGFNKINNAFIVGVGSLGGALLQDNGLQNFGLNIIKAFDNDKTKVGQKIKDITILHIDEFRGMPKQHNVEIGIITVSAENAQTIADLMVAWGIRAIWNFTPARIKVPKYIVVENTMIYTNLAILFNKLSALQVAGE